MQAQAISYGTWPILLTQPDSSRTAPAASIKEDNIRKIIICGGTKNLTKKKQSTRDTVKELKDIFETCKRWGTKEIYVLSLICRPDFQAEINEINKLLHNYAGIF